MWSVLTPIRNSNRSMSGGDQRVSVTRAHFSDGVPFNYQDVDVRYHVEVGD